MRKLQARRLVRPDLSQDCIWLGGLGRRVLHRCQLLCRARIGLYHQAVTANVRAYNLDVSQATQCIVPYLPEHNVNLLIYAARSV